MMKETDEIWIAQLNAWHLAKAHLQTLKLTSRFMPRNVQQYLHYEIDALIRELDDVLLNGNYQKEVPV